MFSGIRIGLPKLIILAKETEAERTHRKLTPCRNEAVISGLSAGL